MFNAHGFPYFLMGDWRGFLKPMKVVKFKKGGMHIVTSRAHSVYCWWRHVYRACLYRVCLTRKIDILVTKNNPTNQKTLYYKKNPKRACLDRVCLAKEIDTVVTKNNPRNRNSTTRKYHKVLCFSFQDKKMNYKYCGYVASHRSLFTLFWRVVCTKSGLTMFANHTIKGGKNVEVTPKLLLTERRMGVLSHILGTPNH